MPEKELVVKVIAMPADTNPDGDMFGGWIVSQMDLAAWAYARKLTSQRIATIAIDKLKFHKPVAVGDCIVCYASLERRGNTSATIKVEVMVERKKSMEIEQVTEGSFTFVATNAERMPVAFFN